MGMDSPWWVFNRHDVFGDAEKGHWHCWIDQTSLAASHEETSTGDHFFEERLGEKHLFTNLSTGPPKGNNHGITRHLNLIHTQLAPCADLPYHAMLPLHFLEPCPSFLYAILKSSAKLQGLTQRPGTAAGSPLRSPCWASMLRIRWWRMRAVWPKCSWDEMMRHRLPPIYRPYPFSLCFFLFSGRFPVRSKERQCGIHFCMPQDHLCPEGVVREFMIF